MKKKATKIVHYSSLCYLPLSGIAAFAIEKEIQQKVKWSLFGKISYGFIGALFDSIKHGSEVSVFQNLSITRDYIHVYDVIYAIRMLLEVDTDLECINISTGIGTTISQVLEIFARKGYNFEKRTEIASNLLIKQVSILDCKTLLCKRKE